MLTTIENAYLFILRVLILVAASVALLVVVLGTVRGAPLIIDRFKTPDARAELSSANLRQWIVEKKAEGVVAPADTSGTSAATPAVPAKIEEAVGLLAQYGKQRLNEEVDRPTARQMMIEVRDTVPGDYQSAYDDSVVGVMQQLLHSTGNPLTLDQISELIHWHGDKVKALADQAAERKAAEATEALQALAVAGGALVAFLLIVFCFLFVKIERNLRAYPLAEATPRGGVA
jgi:hypothetical protein